MSINQVVRKAVMPVAGLGTRFLPATKATPKEMLPVVDKPVIQYVVEEAVAAGLEDILFVTGRAKRALEDHFDFNGELERLLIEKKDEKRLKEVRAASELATIHYARQGTAKGLGHAVLCAKQHVGDEPFAVFLGDEIYPEGSKVLARMFEVLSEFGGSVLLLKKVSKAEVSRYGVAQVKATAQSDVVQVTDLVEKPDANEAPSDLAVMGRYVLSPAIFEILENTKPGRGGEIQLTDAIQVLAQGKGPDSAGLVHGLIYDGVRFDTGDLAGYLETVVEFAANRADVGPEFKSWLKNYVSTL